MAVFGLFGLLLETEWTDYETTIVILCARL